MDAEAAPDLDAVLRALERWGSSRGWIGADPYEGLNSPLGRRLRSRRGRQLVTQAYKRLPLAPPWPLAAAEAANAKALALVLSAYSSPRGRELPHAEPQLARLPRLLRELNLLREGAAWGYPFPVQTRSLAYDERTPNAIATAFVVGALCDAATLAGRDADAELALAARPFLLSLLRREPEPYFAYVPQGSPLIHNANLLVCGALARLEELDRNPVAREAVETALPTTASRIGRDGLWPYGELPSYRWADNFHTAYVLEGMLRVRKGFGLRVPELEDGMRAWKARFFEADGAARYYPDARFPLEAHCYASAIDLLVLAGEPGDLELATAVARSCVRELWLADDGRFGFRRTRIGLNRRAFMRWTNAPMFRALAWLLSASALEHR